MPPRASKISPFTAPTALSTPLPRYRDLSPSRSSTASCAPVEAPDGTAARPIEPSSSTTSTSTVGLPRLSRISRPIMSTMAVMSALSLNLVPAGFGRVLHGAQANVNAHRPPSPDGPTWQDYAERKVDLSVRTYLLIEPG